MDELNSCIVFDMKRRLPSLSALRSFEAAARLQSFKLAAEELSVSATSISHQVRALEETLEVRLFLRKTRAVELTQEGRILLQATGNGFDTIAAGVERLRREQRRSVTLSTTPSFAARWLVPRLASFNAGHPDIALNIQASNSPVDLAGGAADLAVRGGGGHFTGLHARRLLQAGFAPVASPRLKLRKASDVARHPLIHFDWQRGLKSAITWDKWAKAAGVMLDVSAGRAFRKSRTRCRLQSQGRAWCLPPCRWCVKKSVWGCWKRRLARCSADSTFMLCGRRATIRAMRCAPLKHGCWHRRCNDGAL